MRLLHNGKEAFPMILSCIDQAKHSIWIKMFVWRDDAIGNEVLSHLYQASLRGVNIRIDKDRYAEVLEKGEESKQSLFHKPYTWQSLWQTWLLDHAYPMNKPSGYVQRPNPLLEDFIRSSKVQINYKKVLKDHSKFYIFDEELLVLGGINIEDKEHTVDYLNRRYHDYMIMIHSKEVVSQFIRYYVKKETVDIPNLRFVVNQHPKIEIAPTMLQLINEAKEKIIITMAYFGSKASQDALKKAANRGVSIDILTSEFANIQTDYNRKMLKELYEHNQKQVTIRLAKQMIHAKFLLSDDSLCIGSANLNNKGFYHLGELNLLTKDKELIAQVLHSRSMEMKDAFLVQSPTDLKYIKWRAFMEKIAM
jgi:cardiolipin synthase